METELKPKTLAELADISASYASLILTGQRPCPNGVAITVFREKGIRLGFLSEMTAEDIAKLCAQEGVAVCAHAPSSPDAGAPSAKNGGGDFSARQMEPAA